MIRTAPACVATVFLLLPTIPSIAEAGECPSPTSEIATDRPDVTNSSLVVPMGSLQGENGINSTGHGPERAFDGTNSRLRLGVAPCLELLVDLPNYVWGFRGPTDSGFFNVVPAIKWQLNSLPEPWNLSVTAGAGLPTGATKIAGLGVQPYLQFPWSHELGNGWGTSGMLTTFFSRPIPSIIRPPKRRSRSRRRSPIGRRCSSSMSATIPSTVAISNCSTSVANIC
jgi:hypothetical protein